MTPGHTKYSLEKVSDLRDFLEREGLSPEDLARQVPVSNMTWRRLLRLPSETRLPEKYRQILSGAAPRVPFDAPEQIVLTGYGTEPKEVFRRLLEDRKNSGLSHQALLEASETKIGKFKTDKKFWKSAREVFAMARHEGNSRVRLLALAGLFYFVNPFDLIADSIISIGFVDDFGVFSMILSWWKKRRNNG